MRCFHTCTLNTFENIFYRSPESSASYSYRTGSIQKASAVLKLPKFTTRWLRLELSNDGSYGCLEGTDSQKSRYSDFVWSTNEGADL